MILRFVKNRTSTIIVIHSLNLYFLSLSLRNTSKALDIFDDEKQSHIVYGIRLRFGHTISITKGKKFLV